LIVFIVFKAYEWSTEVVQSHTISSNNFFMFYYMLTGVHLFHLLLGLLILGVVARELRNPRRRRMFMVESGATYWHMVDVLWTVIFALLSVVRRANDHHRRTDDHLRVDRPVRDHHSFVAAGSGSCSRCRGRRQRTDHRGGDPFGIHQGTHDHSMLHGSADRTAVAQLCHAGRLTVLWAGILAIYSYEGELN
jgi:hypothetical protein